MKSKKKLITLLVSFLVIAIFAVGGTVAFLYTKDGPVTNIFTPSKVTTEVVETIDGNVKKNVKIKNTGDTDAWIRAYVVITWQDENGNVYGQMPEEDKDYTIDMNVDKTGESKTWYLGNDGFYYWPVPVESEEDAPACCTTGNLINVVNLIKKPDYIPNNYHLNVEIIGSGLQSVPDEAFNSVWRASSGLAFVEGVMTKGDMQ